MYWAVKTVIKSQIGFIFQNFNLISNLPVIENVALPLVYSGFHKTRRLKMASNILEHFHLQEREYYMPWQLSGGQQQRLCIARALAIKPEVLLMDEPTSALDPISTGKIEELTLKLKQDYTIVIVTHNMQQAMRISDKTAFFLLGDLIEFGDTEMMFSTPKEKKTEDYITGRFG